MTDLNRHLQSGFDELRMSENEKRAMRGFLEAHMSTHPLGGMKSPYTWVSFTHMRSLVLVPILILMLGSGTAFAAQGALPGDTLYPIKIHVNEAVAGALAVSDAAKASYNTEVAAERLKEAQALAAQNKLSASTTDQLTQDYEAHAALAVAYADKVDTNDAAKGAELRANLATLQAEGTVLATVAGKDGSEETKHNAVALAVRAGAAAPEDDAAPVHASATMAIALAAPTSAPAPKAFAVQTLSVSATAQDSTGSSRKTASFEANRVQVSAKAIAALQAQATAQLAALRELANSQTLDASTTAALQVRLDDLQSLIDSAQSASDDDVLQIYQRALSQGTVLKTFLSASKKFKLNILSPLLHLQSTIDTEDSSSYPNHRDWHDDDTSVVPTADTPAVVTASTTSSTSGEGSAPSVNSSGGASGSSGGGGAVVQEVIQTVTNGLHL
ncbi:MAG TPA: DUF5667 domain-containing protein [Candidatus Paceibacterota bacterium]|nr:DUF5667 domain-containing protein [Candidatus Paceibacterota bacterium]